MTIADGHAEREAAKAMINDAVQANNDPEATVTLGANKGYDTKAFIDALPDMKVIPPVPPTPLGDAQPFPMKSPTPRAKASHNQSENSSSRALIGSRLLEKWVMSRCKGWRRSSRCSCSRWERTTPLTWKP
jgi:hypothetical protein